MSSQQRKARRSRERVARAERKKAERAARWEAERGEEKADAFSSLSFNLKLDRASDHIEDLREASERWLRTDAYGFVSEQNPQTRRIVVRADIRKPPPRALALLAGDAVHNLRSALDHLALELAVASSRPKSLPPEVEARSEFPIFPEMVGTDTGSDMFHRVKSKTGEPVPGSGLHKLQGVDPDAIKAIEGIQPYHRGPAYAEDPLWVIHELDRIDKHRRPNLTAYAVGAIGIGDGMIGELHVEKMGHDGPVHHGSEVAAFTARNAKFQMNFAREIALAESSLPKSRRNFVAVLTDLRDYVRESVVPLLRPFL